ncbi:hypothetical protein LDO31_12625 [Luteimonas sp. XNQY3]|nr:hypothetical protein [Luteimonas sp. XNQY3]MCD9007063.1 hypothetical protein [Luteimonas sp. XNQY3]
MGLLRIAAIGALGYFAHQAWQRRSSAAPTLDDDTSDTFDRPLATSDSDDAQHASRDAATPTPGASAH